MAAIKYLFLVAMLQLAQSMGSGDGDDGCCGETVVRRNLLILRCENLQRFCEVFEPSHVHGIELVNSNLSLAAQAGQFINLKYVRLLNSSSACLKIKREVTPWLMENNCTASGLLIYQMLWYVSWATIALFQTTFAI